jgi:hypothetical protein
MGELGACLRTCTEVLDVEGHNIWRAVAEWLKWRACAADVGASFARAFVWVAGEGAASAVGGLFEASNATVETGAWAAIEIMAAVEEFE